MGAFALSLRQLQLYQLINRDYEDFVRLSSRLDGLGALSQRLRPPLHEMRQKVAAAEEALVRAAQRRPRPPGDGTHPGCFTPGR